MENLTAKRVGLVPGLLASLLLLGMTFSSPKVEASPAANASISGKQLAWWGPGWGYHHGYGYYGPRYYYRPYGGCYRHCNWNGCFRRCW